MTESKSSAVGKNAAEVRRRYVADPGSYHTAINQQPKVWHTNPDCAAGQEIEVQNLCSGRGDKERRCALC